MAGAESRLKRAAKKMGFTTFPCASSAAIAPSRCRRNSFNSPRTVLGKPATTVEEAIADDHDQTQLQQSICVICLEPLMAVSEKGGGGSGGQAIFTAQCMHSFHFTCISSVVGHGGVTCPICRAEWAQLPCNVDPVLPCHQQPPAYPVLRFLNDSIANVGRIPSLPCAVLLYDDDDPVEPALSPARPRLHISLTSLPTLPAGRTPPSLSHLRRRPLILQQQHNSHFVGPSWAPSPQQPVQSGVWLSARLSHRQATDIVVVVSPNGPHVQLLRQTMALVVFSLRPVDRLAIVTYSAVTATRPLPLRRMTSRGKRMALQAVDRVFYLGAAEPYDGLKKGAKVLEDRAYQNPLSCILHLSDSPTPPVFVPFPVHRFHIGFGLDVVASSGLVVYEFKEFLSRSLGDVIRETRVRIGEEGRTVTLGELRVGEERRVPLAVAGDRSRLRVGYSFVEGGVEEYCIRTGEVVVGVAEKGNVEYSGGAGSSTDMLLVGGWGASPHHFVHA